MDEDDILHAPWQEVLQYLRPRRAECNAQLTLAKVRENFVRLTFALAADLDAQIRDVNDDPEFVITLSEVEANMARYALEYVGHVLLDMLEKKSVE